MKNIEKYWGMLIAIIEYGINYGEDFDMYPEMNVIQDTWDSYDFDEKDDFINWLLADCED